MKASNTEQEKEPNFEASFARLEEILEKLNSGGLGLDESLKLYEEADGLIRFCNQYLTKAEQRVEKLIKNRENELLLNQEGLPETEPFNPDETA